MQTLSLELLPAMAVIALLAACKEKAVESEMARSGVHLSQRHSAYAGTVSDWREFLACWQRRRIDHSNGLLAGLSLESLPVEREVLEMVRAREAVLGVRLPRSYVDFVLSVQLPSENSYPDHQPRFLPVSSVSKLAEFNRHFVDLYTSFDVPVADRDYFVYGTAQRSMMARSRYGQLSDAIVVAYYERFDDAFLLHPGTATTDGEMEAEAIQEGTWVRTPSFAEMMRQWSYYETTGLHGMPYSQRDLRGTCADLLPMKGVWWH